MNQYTTEAIRVLTRLIETPSVSREEEEAANIMEATLRDYGFEPHREVNNVWAFAQEYHPDQPTLLLNAHLDTVRAVKSWTFNPFRANLEGDRLYGLGSNDCGGGLVALLQAFRQLATMPLSCNLVYLASAEEEVSGKNGIARVLPLLPPIDVAIVGEPTGMQPAVAEKGLMVLDVTAYGRSGHAARNEGENAIYKALADLNWFQTYHFERESSFLGPTKMQVTVIQAGTQHNVVPDECRMVVDVRTNECYTNEEVFDIICQHVGSEVKARSFRLGSSSIPLTHPLVVRCVEMGMTPFGSPTLSDQALMSFPSLKLGPGESARSHSSDEFIMVSEIEHAISTYVELLGNVSLST